MLGLIFIYFLKLTSGEENPDGDQCSIAWSYTGTFFVKGSSLAESAVLGRVETNSFLQCCAACDVSQDCHGVASREGECCLIDGTAAADFVTSDGGGDDYKIMLYTTPGAQTKRHCVGDCDLCALTSETDCKLLHDYGLTTDGVYRISPDSAFDAYCDMINGGWTVIQRRVDDSVDFYRGWEDYVAGFGDLTGNFWAGLDKIHELISGSDTELYVSMETFEGETAFAHYTSFSVGDAASGYLMTVGGYRGTAGDSMSHQNNMKFTTYDNDQDTWGDNCAVAYKSAFWYTACHATNPNGLYGSTAFGQGINWSSFKGHTYSLKTIEFKVRRIA